MFTFILAGISAAIALIFLFLALKIKNGDMVAFSIIVFVVGIFTCTICVIGGVVNTFNAIAKQYETIEMIRQLDAQRAIAIDQADSLISTLEVYLVEVYPEHEKEIFSNLHNKDALAYLMHFPKIHANETILSFCNSIESYWGEYYRITNNKEIYLAECRYRLVNPWLVTTFIPELPKDILE